MTAPVISGLVTFIQSATGAQIWDGEIPRQNMQKCTIQLNPKVCLFKLSMEKSGFRRERTTEDPYSDSGILQLTLWSNTRHAVESTMQTIDDLLSESSNWSTINLPGGPADNPFYIYDIELTPWTVIMLENVRDRGSSLIYEGEMSLQIGIHGAVLTR